MHKLQLRSGLSGRLLLDLLIVKIPTFNYKNGNRLISSN